MLKVSVTFWKYEYRPVLFIDAEYYYNLYNLLNHKINHWLITKYKNVYINVCIYNTKITMYMFKLWSLTPTSIFV